MNILRENLELKQKIKILESKLQNQTSNDDSYNLLFRIGKSFLLGTFPKASSKNRALRLRWARGPSAAARTDLESCRLGNYTLGKLPPGKIPFESCRFVKDPWEST